MTIILNHDCDCATCRCRLMCGERDAVDSFDDFTEVESFRDNFRLR